MLNADNLWYWCLFLKALIISVGTGTRPSADAVESLANALAFSITHHNPDKIFFVVSRESLENTLPLILKRTETRNYEVIRVDDPDDIQRIYEDLKLKFREIRAEYKNLAVDYTSGTKAMTGALTILGAIFEADELSYIMGKRVGGIVQRGTETIKIVRPYFAIFEQKIRLAIEFFNRNQFRSAIRILMDIRKRTADPEIIKRIEPLEKLARAYEHWDRFQHEEACKGIMELKIAALDKNKRFLGRLMNELKSENGRPEPYYIADLINNAKRRGEIEEKYDDAVARLYRTVELIAHYRLKRDYEIDPQKPDMDQIPTELKRRWSITDGEPIRLSLKMSYELLEVEGDTLGKRFLEDTKMQGLLSRRNQSILAHGINPINKEIYISLLKKTTEYAKETIENLQQLMEDSKFVRWKY